METHSVSRQQGNATKTARGERELRSIYKATVNYMFSGLISFTVKNSSDELTIMITAVSTRWPLIPTSPRLPAADNNEYKGQSQCSDSEVTWGGLTERQDKDLPHKVFTEHKIQKTCLTICVEIFSSVLCVHVGLQEYCWSPVLTESTCLLRGRTT